MTTTALELVRRQTLGFKEDVQEILIIVCVSV